MTTNPLEKRPYFYYHNVVNHYNNATTQCDGKYLSLSYKKTSKQKRTLRGTQCDDVMT